MQIFQYKSGSVHVLGTVSAGVCVELKGFGLCVCVCVCLGGVDVCSCRQGEGAAETRQVQEKKEVRRRKTEEEEEDSWKYSAVIHKVESTTKLLATV